MPMKGFTSPLWPIRYKPLPDELLSSWLVRLAHGHGLKVQTFCNLIFGDRHQVWNRDIDRLGPDWLVKELSARTGTSLQIAYGTTLRAYEGLLYPQFKLSGVLQWILTLQMYHRKHEGFGLQFCPLCLREGPAPYFRKSWRVAFNTVCPAHQCMMQDRCPVCETGVAFHRQDMGKHDCPIPDTLAICHKCGFDLGQSGSTPIVSFDTQVDSWLNRACQQLGPACGCENVIDIDTLGVMRQLGKLLVSPYSTIKLHAHICSKLGVQKIPLSTGRLAFELRPLLERHHLMQLLGWLMLDLEPRLRTAWRAKAVQYNHLCKDYNNAPAWFQATALGFSDWRHR